MTLTHVFAPITKSTKQADGTMLVEGKATGPDLDADLQICDPAWLAKAMPAWFETGANVREMHQPIAAGVGRELAASGDDWMLKSLVIDPGTVAKLEAEVLRGYSIGIRGPKVVKDAAAPGGRICGGAIVEVSLVDRPANPTCTVMLAKSAKAGTITLTKDDGTPVDTSVDGSVETEATAAAPDATVEPAETPDDEVAEEVVELSLLDQARAALLALLAGEVDEMVDGDGGIGPVRVLVYLLDDLAWFAECDAYDDLASAVTAMKAALTHKEDIVKLSTVAELVKAASADTATAEEKAELADLRKVLGIDELSGTVTTAKDAMTKANALEERVAKVEEMAAPGGPARFGVKDAPDVSKAARTAEADRLDRLSKSINDGSLSRGYAALAAQLREDVAAA